MKVQPADDSFHEIADPDDPYWNESSWIGFMVPERRITGALYFFHRPNMGYTIGGVMLWDDKGAESINCLYYDWGEPYPMPAGADMYDFSLPNGFSVECVEPLQTFRFRYEPVDNWYEGKNCSLDLTFQAFMEPHASGLPEGSEEWGGHGHYEQPGRMTGTLTINGETLDIDCWTERDRSWGSRKLKANPRGHFPWGIASEDHGFHVIAVSPLAPEDEVGVGTVEKVITGWYRREGVTGSVVDGRCRTLERAEDGRPLRVEVTGTDNLGRDFRATGQAHNALNWHGYNWMLTWWCQMEWDLDGEQAWGEEQDFWPTHLSRKLIRDGGIRRQAEPASALR